MRTPSGLIRLFAILGLVTLAAPAAWGACPIVGPGPTYTLSIPPPYAGVSWSGCNLTNANMSGQADLTGAALTGYNLTGMNLAGATFNNAILTNANLTRADLSRADVHTANISGTVLLRAILTSTDLTGSIGTPASYVNGSFLNTTCPDGSHVTSPNTCWSVAPTVSCTLDVDGNGAQDALTDGLIVIRALFGLTGTAVTNNAIGDNNPTRSDWTAIRTYLNINCGSNFAQ